MNEEMISFETAKLANEKGFTRESLGVKYGSVRPSYYNHLGELDGDCTEHIKEYLQTGECHNYDLIPASTQSVLQKWLRENHKIHIYIDTTPIFDPTQGSKYRSAIKIEFQPFKWTTAHYYLGNTYEEVLEKGLTAALKIIK